MQQKRGGVIYVGGNGAGDTNDGTESSPYASLDKALEAAGSKTDTKVTIKVSGDISWATDSNDRIDIEKDITIEGVGETPSTLTMGNRAIRVESGTFTLKNVTVNGAQVSKDYGFDVQKSASFVIGENATITGYKNATVIQVESSASLTINGSIVSNEPSSYVLEVEKEARVTFAGGSIHDNKALPTNGDDKVPHQIVNLNGTFTMSSGEIYQNSGILIGGNAGAVTLSGGTIRNNSGAVVFLGGVATFKMTGGSIVSNVATKSADGDIIKLSGGNATFEMTGGVISGNTASCAVFVSDKSSTCTIEGGSIINNTLSYFGLSGSTSFIFKGAPQIYGNSSNQNFYIYTAENAKPSKVEDSGLTDGANIGVTLQTLSETDENPFATGTRYQGFFSDKDGYASKMSNSTEKTIVLAKSSLAVDKSNDSQLVSKTAGTYSYTINPQNLAYGSEYSLVWLDANGQEKTAPTSITWEVKDNKLVMTADANVQAGSTNFKLVSKKVIKDKDTEITASSVESNVMELAVAGVTTLSNTGNMAWYSDEACTKQVTTLVGDTTKTDTTTSQTVYIKAADGFTWKETPTVTDKDGKTVTVEKVTEGSVYKVTYAVPRIADGSLSVNAPVSKYKVGTVALTGTGLTEQTDGSYSKTYDKVEDIKANATVTDLDGNPVTGGVTCETTWTKDGETVTGGPVDAGTYTANIVVKVTGKEVGTATKTVVIHAKELTVGDVEVVSSRVFDGTKTAEITKRGALQGLVKGDETVTLDTDNLKAEYNSEHVKSANTVTVTGFALKGNDKGNYVLSTQLVTKAATITPAKLNVTGDLPLTGWNAEKQDGNVYAVEYDKDNAVSTPKVNVDTFAATAEKGKTTFSGSEVDYVYEWYKGEKKLEKAPTECGTYELRVAITSNGDYAGDYEATVPVKVTIEDTIAPTGEIAIDDDDKSHWDEFIEKFDFTKLFYNEKKKVTITTSDGQGMGVSKIEYFYAPDELTEETLKAKDEAGEIEWKTVEGTTASFDMVEKADEGKQIVYVRVTDKKGNASCISSDGLVFDFTSAVVKGVVSNETYTKSVPFTVMEINLKTVKVNGEEVQPNENGEYILVPSDKAYTITVEDKAGNITTVSDIKVQKETVELPVIDSKTYTSETLTADIAADDRYTVVENKGGVDAGTYEVRIKLVNTVDYEWADGVTVDTDDNGTAVAVFEIKKATATVTAPEAEKLTYTGEAQKLVTAGKTDGGELQYRLGETGEWTSEVPTAAEAGEYTVYYRVVGGANYEDVAETKVTVTIGKKTPSVTAPEAEKLTYTGEAQKLVTAGKTDGGKLQYRLGETGEWTSEIPTAVTPGEYTVYYRVVGDANFESVEQKAVKVTVAKKPVKDAKADVVLGDALTYNGKEQTQTVTKVVVDGVTVPADTYTITKNVGTNPGTYVMTITFNEKSNYTGSITKEFTIAEAAKKEDSSNTGDGFHPIAYMTGMFGAALAGVGVILGRKKREDD